MGYDPAFPKTGKKIHSKFKSVKIYKKKRSKIELFKEEVDELQKKYAEIDSQAIQTFDDFPLSEKTKKALKEANYITPTEIQKDSIGLALNGHDILGAAKTGSGKTLAFVIPILEHLYCSGWSIVDGLATIVITPTRELAYQIFEVLRKVGAKHNFSAALVIGGKDLAKEREVIDRCSILICTPGRLLQHMDENPLFDASNMKLLILDEADRILDLGFQKSVNAILQFLPKERQTLLFSATQTKSVKDLARLSLKNPVYVSVHEHAKHSTPESLRQNYLVCEAHTKINLLWSFIKNHKHQKTLVFMATCKQVKYTFESICRLRPGVSIMALYGSLHQLRRLEIYNEFCKKSRVVMLATDVAARGLDFPNVNWVVQLDCPEDANTYIHRAGRTARYQKNGESLLVLLPSEKDSMVEQLTNRKIPIEEIKVNPQKFQNIQRKLEAICARDVELKNSGQRAFKTYVKSITLMKDKTVFDLTKIDTGLYAKSLGLAKAPRCRFVEKRLKKADQKSEISPENDFNGDTDSEDDLLMPKGEPVLPPIEEDNVEESKKSEKLLTKAAIAKRTLKKKIKANTVTKFDEEGIPIREVCGKSVPVVAADLQNQMLKEGYSIELAKLLKEKEEVVDKIIYRERIKMKHKEEKLKRKAEKRKDQNSAPQLEEPNEIESGDSEGEMDPNKLMNSVSSEEEEEEEEEEEDDEQINPSDSEGSDFDADEEIQISGKRKIESSPEKVKRQKTDTARKTQSKFVRSLDDDEQLALHFLANS